MYQISSELEPGLIQGCEEEKEWCARENQAPVGNQRRKWLHNRSVLHSYASSLPLEPPLCTHFCFLLSHTLYLSLYSPIFGTQAPPSPAFLCKLNKIPLHKSIYLLNYYTLFYICITLIVGSVESSRT